MEIKKILNDHKLWRETGGQKGARAHLVGTNLVGANLEGANLADANLADANLARAYLEGAYLVGANLAGANLEGANLEGANLEGAYLVGANLAGAYLEGAYLEGAYLVGAYLRDARGILQWQSPQGEKRICCSVKAEDCVMHKLGCFWGTTEEAVAAIRKKYGENSLYEEFLLLQVKALEQEWGLE